MVICVVVGSGIYKFAGHCSAQYGGKVTAYPVGNDRKPHRKGADTQLVRRLSRKSKTTTSTLAQENKFVNNALQSRFARLLNLTITRQQIKQQAALAARSVAPLVLAFTVSSIAHAQSGSIDMSGATTVMNSFKTFALYAGAVICLGSLIFAGIRLMGGRFQEAIPGLFGALFGAGVLGWGAGWISSLTGQTVTQ